MSGLDNALGRGTAWSIWDLHVHTPASLVQSYGGDDDAVWARFIDDLEGLPSSIDVVGINDYWFLDGYERVLKARSEGRLTNLAAIFPVIEMRLDQFGGTAGDLSRVNLHAIFDPDLDPEKIRAQFINALQPRLRLAPEHSSLDWQGVVTRESLIDLGQKIKATVPSERLNDYESDLKEGFNNLNVALNDVLDVLDGPFFKGRALLGVGKTEWANIKWSAQSIAAKKNAINSASLVFTAYEDTTRWRHDVETLRESNVTHRVLDCSDAHNFSDSSDPMRLGACQTWMNTVPTFAGLAYALKEFDRRVYVGLEPPSIERVRSNPERFISSITVRSDDDSFKLFDYELPLNTGYVAVVGNKGQGKSALLDCIALAGNSSRNKEFAFLNSKRFLSPSNQKEARKYLSHLKWVSGSNRKVPLSDEHDRSAPVSVEYLPQAFVERVCNVDPTNEDADEFERELRTVLFSHISEEDRAGEKSFDALLRLKTRTSQDALERLRKELRTVITEYVAIAEFQAENQISDVDGRLEVKQQEVDQAKAALLVDERTLTAFDESSNDNQPLADLKQRAEDLETEQAELLARRTESERRQADLQHALSEMASIFARAKALEEDAEALASAANAYLPNLDEPLISFTLRHEKYTDWKLASESQLNDLRGSHNSLVAEIAVQAEATTENSEALAAADSERERARQRVIQSRERLADLIGDESAEDSLKGLTSLRERILNAPHELERLRERLVDQAQQIYTALRTQLDAVRSLYAPASAFIAQAEALKNAGLEFNAELRLLPKWQSIPAGLDGRRNGDFVDWLTDLPSRIEGASWDQLAPELETAVNRLEHERGEVSAPLRNPATAMRNSTSLADFLAGLLDLSWIEVRFGLTGDGLPLSQLSPGQRGLVLALFYLVVDRRATPLLLDQPEENLDNETIASKLVPAIHEAAGRRQTIAVTHNANLAIVGDADQIVHCQMVDGHFTVSSGSIAELDVAQFALNVLEGTKPAFDNRRNKYETFPELG